MKKLNKPVYLIGSNINLKEIDTMVKSGITYFTKISKTVYDQEDFSSGLEINKLTKTRLNGDESLFFMSNSKFPRTKLTGTNFKRVIKPQKADVFVYKNIFLFESQIIVNLFETKNAYFAIPYNIRFRYLDLEEYKLDPEKYIKTYVQDIAQLDPVYLGEKTLCIPYNENRFLLEAILNGTAKPMITDNDLDKQICEGLPEITGEEVFSIKEMIESKDDSISGLGLKLIGSYNLEKYKQSLRIIVFRHYSRLKRLNEWNCASFKQVRSSILNLPYSISSQYFYTACLKDAKDKDKEVCIKILFDFFQKDCAAVKLPNLALINKRLKFSICQV